MADLQAEDIDSQFINGSYMKSTILRVSAIFLPSLFLCVFSGNTLAEDSGANPKTDLERYVVTGKGTIFALHEPSGWKMDTNSANNNGLPVVFYPAGQTWKTASVVIYANTALNDCHTSFESFIADDEAEFRHNSSKIMATKIAEMKADNLRVVIKSFKGDRYGNTEAVAYLDNAGGSFISIVLSSRTEKIFDETYPIFKELVSSFQLVANSTSCSASKAHSNEKAAR